MKFWLLIVIITSPGGDRIDRFVDDFDTRLDCLQAQAFVRHRAGEFHEQVQTYCIQLKEPI
jgi:hypothetical protein